MNWGQNKFIVGFGVVMLVGCGALGFLCWQASSQFGALNDEYQEQVTKLQGLQNQPLYPEQSNLERIEALRDDAIKDADGLQAQLTPMSFPVDRISPEQFQDKLRATVSAIGSKAAAAGIKLPDKFYLGFSDYQGKLPSAEAAPALNRELRAVELAVSTLIDSKISAITNVTRDPIPEEGQDSKGRANKPQGLQAQRPANSSTLVSKSPFEIQFSSEQPAFRRAVNALVSSPQQFFVVRPVTIKNSVDKQINKQTDAPGAQRVSAAVVSRNGKQPAKDKNLKFLVGTEKLNVSLRLEMVVFANTVAK